ncbi:MAG: hypothetical protein JXB29_13135 [Sedimentisphaerales bacterium]|nr:hypothetical protein [Sedimentisphaerales bacterium]
MTKLKVALKEVFLLTLSMVTGVLIWVLSPIFTGEAEPWDSASGYYHLSMLVSGFLIGFLGPKKAWLWPIGIYSGQFVYCLVKSIFLSSGAGVNFFYPIGMIFLIPYCLISFLGSLIGAGIRKKLWLWK